MRAVFGTGKVHHAINASEGSPSTTISMGVELLLGQDVAARLDETDRTQLDVAECKTPLAIGGVGS
jgi:hypothetical protein